MSPVTPTPDNPKRWLAFDIGCIECGEDSAVVGTFATKEEAQAACDAAEDAQRANWTGQHAFEVFDLLSEGAS